MPGELLEEDYTMSKIDKLKDRMPCNKPRREIKGGKKSVVRAW